MSLVSLARAAGRDVAVVEQPFADRQRVVAAGRHEHDVDQTLPRDLADVLAILGQRAHANFAGVHLGRAARGADAECHVGVLGVGQDEVLAAGRIGVNGGQLAIERFLHGSGLERLTCWSDSRCSTVSIVCRSTWPLLRRAWTSLGHSSISCVATTPAAPTTVGTRQRHVANSVAAALHRRNRQDRAAIQGDGLDHFLNRQSDGKARAALLLDHFGARALGAREQLAGQVRRPAGKLFQRQAGHGGAGPDRHHAVAMLAQDQRLDLRRRRRRAAGRSGSESESCRAACPGRCTRAGGKSSRLAARYVSTSTGFETTSTVALGLCPALTTWPRMLRNRSTLRLIRSSRLSSGLRRRPAVMQIRSLVGMCS